MSEVYNCLKGVGQLVPNQGIANWTTRREVVICYLGEGLSRGGKLHAL